MSAAISAFRASFHNYATDYRLRIILRPRRDTQLGIRRHARLIFPLDDFSSISLWASFCHLLSR